MRFQFAGVSTKCVPDWVIVLFHVCKTDCPAGMSKSIRQSVSCAKLEFVTVKWAMKPVCHVELTDNVAVTAAACAMGGMASPRVTAINAETAT
ncbi:hypothetical protein MSAS_05030 [Mycobacterium saskatchewanense]|nr:hypothetical protein MSAS_05030 [Mycobacterium saskatchewanense]